VKGRGPRKIKGLLGFALRCDGTKTDLLYVDGGPGHHRHRSVICAWPAIRSSATPSSISPRPSPPACAASNIEIADVDWFVPHQANQRIIRGVGDRLGLDEEKVISTVALHANTSAASIPLALDAAIQDGRIKRGDLVLMEAMGGGLTWGACAFRL
jgi:3-oxoacyl-[acyl-carrier-protein] synthase-3